MFMSYWKPSSAVMARRRKPDTGVDYYPTPPAATHALLSIIKGFYPHPDALSGLSCLEPAAGGGHMSDVLQEAFGKVEASDIADPEGRGWGGQDFLQSSPPERKYDWLITNPPFRLAEQFILRASDFARNWAFLCRLSLLEGIGRYTHIWQTMPPSLVAVFVKRLAMVEGRLPNKQDPAAVCYAWFVWKENDRSGRVTWIHSTDRGAYTLF